jgi:hypothetical protein
MKIIKTLCLSLSLLFVGCAHMPGKVTENISEFEGTKEISVEPIGTSAGSALMLGGHWTSRLPDVIYIDAKVAYLIAALDAKDGLLFNVDGEIISLSSPTTLTDTNTTVAGTMVISTSQRPYTTTREALDKIIKGKVVKVKLKTLNKGYTEGTVSGSGAMKALQSLAAAIEEAQP